MRNIKKALIYLLCIPLITITMESSQTMTVVRALPEVQPFADRFVVYQPRKTLGEDVVLPEENAEYNYGYIDSHLDHYPDGVGAPKGPAYLKLFALRFYTSCAITRVISDKTLAQEALSLRLATPVECKRIEKLLETKELFLQYQAPGYNQESNCSFMRYALKNSNYSYKKLADILKDQIAGPENKK